MSNTIIELRYSYATGNVPSSLANGEVAINTYDGKLFYRGGASNTVQTIERYQGPAGLNGELQFNDSGVLGSDAGLTYNKTTNVITIDGGAIVGSINVVPQIAAAFLAANTPSHVANSAASYANSAFLKANTPDYVANSAASYANAAFARANNSLDANNGGTVTGTITATSFITTGSYGNILGANTIYANNIVANTGYIQFADGTKQYTANAGAGGGGSSYSFATISNTATALVANTSNTRLTIVGESGIAVAMNSTINQITVAANYIGAQGLTVDYGYVTEPAYYGFDYGYLS
jgi:hypothetical protein